MPGVTRNPTRLQNEAGTRIDPPASSPMPTRARLAATAVPEPLLDPPGSRVTGMSPLLVPQDTAGPTKTSRSLAASVTVLVIHEVAKSGIVVLPRMIAPAALSYLIAVASSVGT